MGYDFQKISQHDTPLFERLFRSRDKSSCNQEFVVISNTRVCPTYGGTWRKKQSTIILRSRRRDCTDSLSLGNKIDATFQKVCSISFGEVLTKLPELQLRKRKSLTEAKREQRQCFSALEKFFASVRMKLWSQSWHFRSDLPLRVSVRL